MNFIKQHRLLVFGLALILAVGGFLAFRPDKLLVDDTVNESLSDAFAAASPATTATTTAAEPTGATTVTTVPSVESTLAPEVAADEPQPPVEPTAVVAGEFYGIDHSAEGSATIYEQDGRYILRFEDDTDIQNGPDLYVWVLPSDDYDGGSPTEYLDLGKLKGNVGGQNYELPEDFDPDVHGSILIWCLRFGVPFAAVPLG
jgi:hypothetical protein